MDDKQQFSKRLKAAMAAAGLEIRPTALEKLFNLHYRGTPVTYQGVRRWLIGLSIPEQDKLELLASLLDTDADTLRYGTKPRARAHMPKTAWAEATTVDDRIAIEIYLRLPSKKRQAIRQVIKAMADKT
ncbi:transcriptional regulator [Thermomonas brevis]|uniref:Transcriptional regulator n=1 Tax=Thermomonas brevis TaxID=215691 RepID=A0A7G9QXC8_9GAMM|nr:transcriptional regulator [Thermomonas brevis]QNN48003.1 transcriptional regulator [Thermomonas brevis]